MLKVLWFTNTPAGYAPKGNAYNGGGWITSLQSAVAGKVELAVVFVDKTSEAGDAHCSVVERKAVSDGVTYYPIPNRYDESRADRVRSLFFGDRRRRKYLLEACSSAVRDFRPDVIEVFGTEHLFALVDEHWQDDKGKEYCPPVCIHLQGLMEPYWRNYLPFGESLSGYVLMNLKPSGVLGRLYALARMKRGAEAESEIMGARRHFLGRTSWDRECSESAFLAASEYVPMRDGYTVALRKRDKEHFVELHEDMPDNEIAKALGYDYRHCGEILRPCFYEASKHFPSESELEDYIAGHAGTARHLKLISTISSVPYKGLDVILRTAKRLREECRGLFDFEWSVYGNVEPAYAEKITGISVAEAGVTLCGVIDAEGLAARMTAEPFNTVYVHPSYIDNSPNSLCEAQLVGLPVVACEVGGVGSLVEHGKTGFLVPPADDVAIAGHIKEFSDVRKAYLMGKSAHEAALVRHDADAIVGELMDIYESLVREETRHNS